MRGTCHEATSAPSPGPGDGEQSPPGDGEQSPPPSTSVSEGRGFRHRRSTDDGPETAPPRASRLDRIWHRPTTAVRTHEWRAVGSRAPSVQAQFANDVPPEVADQNRQIDFQSSGEPHQNVQARSLLSSLEIPYVIEGDPCRFSQSFLRPASLGAKAAKRLPEEHCFGRLSRRLSRSRHRWTLTFHTIVGNLPTNDHGYWQDT